MKFFGGRFAYYRYFKYSPIILTILVGFSCAEKALDGYTLEHGKLKLEFNQQLHSRVNAHADQAKPLMEAFVPSEYLMGQQGAHKDFVLNSVTQEAIESHLGSSERVVLLGESESSSFLKKVTLETYKDFPDLAVLQVAYVNQGNAPVSIHGWANHAYTVQAQGNEPPFWSFQSGSYESRPDWVLPVKENFSQENCMGMNASDYGGGTPVTDIWRPDVGIAVGHIEPVPRLVSLPVEMGAVQKGAKIGVHFEKELVLSPKDTLKTFKTFVTIHEGDYYNALKRFSNLMQASGLAFSPPEDQAFEPIWCAWGYEREFTVDEVISTLPKVKDLGIEWAVLDDGFQIAEGDWDVNPEKFPGGDKDMRKLVDAIHAHGLKAKLWWAPLAVDPGTQLLKEDPEILLINEEGQPQDISWWDSYYMSPAYEGTIDHTKEVVGKFLKTWDFDGLKMDGQHMNAVPPDYNESHNLNYPEESVEQLPQFFKMVYNTARGIKPNAVVENCPCGTACSFYNMASMNQSVSSDPTSSWQIRLKGKTYKALMDRHAYYGDHVELSDGGNDFASSFGVGAVLGTKFTWPKDNPNQSESYLLTPAKEKIWRKWFDLYNEKMLSKADYRGGLYDIGYDKPETHAIQKGDTLHYAFYAEYWDDEVELRGLDKGKEYVVRDYLNEVALGTVSGNDPRLQVAFEDDLLIEVYPK